VIDREELIEILKATSIMPTHDPMWPPEGERLGSIGHLDPEDFIRRLENGEAVTAARQPIR
jgi:hypothetical protein